MENNKHNFDEELIDIYDLDGNFVRTQNRKEFSEEIKKTYLESGEVKFSVKSVGALILNSNKEFLMVQRGDTFDSPGLIDKTIGGHVSSGDDYDETVIRELGEEIGIPGIVAKDANEFNELLNTVDTTRVAVLLLLDHIDGLMVDVEGLEAYKRCFNASVYMGIYDGKITEFPDGTAKKSIKIPLLDSLDTISKDKNKFTTSVSSLIEKYGDLILSKIK